MARKKRRADGRVEAKVTLEDGTRRSVYGKNEAELRKNKEEILRRDQLGMPLKDVSMTLAELTQQWLDDKKFSWKPKTYQTNYERMFNYVLPIIGHIDIHKLKVPHVDKLKSELLNQGLAPTTANSCKRALNGVLEWAIDREFIIKNVAAKSDYVKVPKKSVVPRDMQYLNDFRDAVRHHRWAALFILQTFTAMRHEDILGMQWSDIDFDTKTITAPNTLQRLTAKTATAYQVQGGWFSSDAKSKSGTERVWAMVDPDLILHLRQLKEVQEAQQEHCKVNGVIWSSQLKYKEGDLDPKGNVIDSKSELIGQLYPEWTETSDLIFTREDGNPLHQATVLHTMKKLLKDAGVDYVNMHGLRKAVPTVLAAMGVPQTTTAKILGHSQVSLTNDIYTQVHNDSVTEALKNLV